MTKRSTPLNEPGLSAGERALLKAIRRPGNQTIRVKTRASGIKDIDVEETFPSDGHSASVSVTVNRLLSEAANQDLVIKRRNGRVVSYLRKFLFRF